MRWESEGRERERTVGPPPRLDSVWVSRERSGGRCAPRREALGTRPPTGGRRLPRRERWGQPVCDVKIARECVTARRSRWEGGTAQPDKVRATSAAGLR
jgi:hypothetical protein